MQCNIDARGKAVRLILGLAMFFAGVGMIVLWLTGHIRTEWTIYAGAALTIAGAFAAFEGWAGWCVVRALGIKTRI